MKKACNNYLGRNLSKAREDDKMSPETRSALMSKIRSSGSKLEESFISELVKVTSSQFERNVREIRGKPDIVFEKQKVCVFLDSDFWHGWQYPRWKHLLKNDHWRMKIEKNRARDKAITRYLRRKGWKVVRIWEHDIKKDKNVEIESVLNLLK